MSQPVGRLDIETLIHRVGREAARREQGEPLYKEAVRERRERLEKATLHAARLRELVARQEETGAAIEAFETRARQLREARYPRAERVRQLLGPQAPAGASPGGGSRERVHTHLGTALEVAPVGASLPDFSYYSPVKRWVARAMARGVLFLAGILTAHQRLFNASVIGALDALLGMIEETELAQLKARGSLLGVDEQATRLRLETFDRDARIDELSGLVSTAGAWHERLDALEERVTAAESALRQQETGSFMESLQARVAALEEKLRHLESHLGGRLVETEADRARKAEEVRSLASHLEHLRSDVALQEQRLSLLLEEARRRLPEPLAQQQLEVFAGEEDHLLDSLYVAFEDRFRGSRQEIKNRAAVYLGYVEEAGAGTVEAPVLDVGCGRGEWLELLKERGLQARGVDRNRVFVHSCRQRSLQVIEGDGLGYLREQPDNSLGMVTSFHVLEHLPLATILALLGETLRVLRAGGVALFETPNPCNLIVGASYFRCDPTHRNALHPQTLKFLAEQRGFVRVEAIGQHDFRPGGSLDPLDPAEPLATKLNPIIEIIETNFLAPWDYAVVARKVL